jgi:hypothetical protein
LIVTNLASHHQGYKSGADSQAVADQAMIAAANSRTQGIIDGYNVQIGLQKAEANTKYRTAQSDIIALQADRDKFKTKLGEQHVKNQDVTNRLRDVYYAYGLRFQAAESARSGDCSGCSQGARTDGACNEAVEIVQLPEAIARDLRQLAYEADQLNDDYQLCYAYTHPVAAERKDAQP